MVRRYEELDSLRGIAALTVVINHFFNVIPMFFNANNYPNGLLLKILKFTPVHIFWAGHEAVILFFVLSGFVLALPFLKNKQGSYKDFLVKRFFRIYIPYICAVTAAIILKMTISRNGIEELGKWFNFAWTEDITLSQILHHLFVLGDFKNYVFDPVIWSLIHELRISLVFPFIMILVIKYNYKICLGFALTASVISYYVKTSILYKLNYMDYSTSFVDSLHYMSMFIVGALLAKYREKLQEYIKNRLTNMILFGSAILFYTYPWWFLIYNESVHKYVINDWMITIGATIFIILSFSSKVFSTILSLGIFKFLGKISYSLYLFHAIVLLSFINLWYGVLPYWLIIVLAFPAAIMVSWIAYYAFEKPSMEYGRRRVKQEKSEQPRVA
ncbi:acyltransferase family protein [Neobacillus niacini]|uniref:acyltransferase family protein n=1 Tax=Neobacillus niacini TaxID=86668 RepID=UPI003B01793B